MDPFASGFLCCRGDLAFFALAGIVSEPTMRAAGWESDFDATEARGAPDTVLSFPVLAFLRGC